MNHQPSSPLPDQSKKLKVISVILSCILGLALPPSVPLFMMAGVATIMMTDSGPNLIITTAIVIVAFVFWAIPFSMMASLIAAHKLRKSGRLSKSIVLQAIPLIIFFALVLFIFL